MMRGRFGRRAAQALVGGSLIAAAGAGVAWGFWLASASNDGRAAADTILQGNTPSVSVANATTVNVSWTASSTVSSHAVTGYVIARYATPTGGSPVAAGGTCAGVVTTLSCADSGVTGDWYYTVTPRISAWAGPESARSAVAAAASKLAITSAAVNGTASTSATLGPITVAIQNSANVDLNAPTGGVVVDLASSSAGKKFAATSGGSAIGSVTIPAGTATTNVFYGDTAAGSPTTTASTATLPLANATQVETITPAAANKLAFGQQPTSATAGVAIAPAVTVQVQDQFGNLTSSTASVTLAIGTNPGAGTLSGTTSVNAVAGTATFSNLSINKSGTGYTLNATSTVTGAASSTFNITAAAASKMCFVSTSVPTCLVGQQNVTNGGTFSGRVMLQDSFGNQAVASAGGVFVSFTVNGDLNPPSPLNLTIASGTSFGSVSASLPNGASKNGVLTATASSLTNTTATVTIHA